MNRRKFLMSAAGTVAVLPMATHPLFAAPIKGAEQTLALPTADQLAWQDLEIGMFVHIAPNTWQDKESDDLSTPLSAINPDIDTDNWAECAVQLGARYIIFVAKHAGGFCMWNTQTTEYGIGNTPWKSGRGDVLKELAASCQKRGLKLGVYLSPRDDHFGAGTGGVCKDKSRQAAYNSLYRAQLTEVLSRYGQMVEVWFDGSNVVPTSDIVHKYAPHAAIFQGPDATIRWVGNEDGFAPYPAWNAVSEADAKTGVSTAIHGDPDGARWLPVEADVSIRRPYWFWSTTNETNLLTLDQLLEVYYRSVGRGAQLVLNIPPDRSGHMPGADFARAREFGEEVRRRFGKSVADTAGGGKTTLLHLPQQRSIDHIILEEDCRYGQRIRKYQVEGLVRGQWTILATGTAIGHKRIQAFDPKEATSLRLTILESVGEPHIRRFAAFDTKAQPPRSWDAATQIWAADAVGKWRDFKFEVDISSKTTKAKQYRLRFVSESGRAISIQNAELLLDGVQETHLLRKQSDAPDVLLLTITGIGQKAIIRGTIAGDERGTILMQEL
jgi:alpha-L-fucosidase